MGRLLARASGVRRGVAFTAGLAVMVGLAVYGG